MPHRYRFAPSPTGVLHVGGARTALYNYLLARADRGEFILRIEDTDRERSTEDAVGQIIDGLKWLGFDWDDGPHSQYDRRKRHRAVLDELLEEGFAYRSTATSEDVRQARERNDGQGFRGNAEDAESAAVRLKVPDEGETVVCDLIKGDTRFENRLIDDFVIARSDGTPLYNFAVAVDDLDMGITCVVRGEDHLSNTPKQLLVLDALDAKIPSYAHLPLLHGTDGKKLSKRHGAASIEDLCEAGYLPEAVVNYIALLGWGYDDKTTFFTHDELIEKFSLENVSSSPAIFDEKKLRWMNGNYIRNLETTELAGRIEEFLKGGDYEATGQCLVDATALVQEKISTLDEFWPMAGFFFEQPEMDERSWNKVFKEGKGSDELKLARDALGDVEPYNEAEIDRALRDVVERLDAKPKTVFQPIRVAISGSTVSPGIFESLALLGKLGSLDRIDIALRRLNAS